MFTPDHTDPDRLDQLWDVMQGEKGDIEHRSEEYARWTIPSLCPESGTEHSEQQKADVPIGPRLVNHLANKIVDTMFPHDRPFFAVALTPDARKRIREEAGKEGEAVFAEAVRAEATSVEEAAMRKLRLSTYRPQAVEAVRHQIVTGNVILRRLPDDSRVVYGIKDFCIRRDITGKPIEVILKDAKMFGSLPPELQAKVAKDSREFDARTPCVLFTHFKLDGSRWAMRQAVDDILVGDGGTRYKPKDVPFLALVWNLARGENYGRGLVEDHTTAFHHVDVLTKAGIDMIGVMSDIKFLVDPSSVLDPVELNNSPRGSYHQGRKDDITTPEGARRLEIKSTFEVIAGLERELAQAFLLNSAGVRHAERVTAEEIRFIAMELESAFGGLYSRLAIEWQRHEAEYAVSQINFATDLGDAKTQVFEVIVTTGLESLSREGQLDNLRRALADLQMLETVPEDIRATINPTKFANFIFSNHSVKWEEFLFTEEQMKANQEAAMAHEQKMMEMQSQAKVAEAAGTKAVQEQ